MSGLPFLGDVENMSKSILVDTTLCIGCGQCVVACKETNHLPPAPSDNLVNLTLSEKTLNVVESHGPVFVRRFCMHCEDPTCASVCPVGAFQKTAAGPVIYKEDLCIGCRYCMMACPFGIPRYEWEKIWAPRVKKCHMCKPRQDQGLQPSCTEVCPVQAGIFGEREDLLKEAQRRIDKEPQKYFPHIYGKDEAGGTSVLYLSAVPFDALGLPADLPPDALPNYTYRVLSKLPRVISATGVLLGGIYWITNRREEVAKAEKKKQTTEISGSEKSVGVDK
jgi:formate dehydrogenase iron-sulfur subunit